MPEIHDDLLRLQVESKGNGVNADAYLEVFSHTLSALRAIDKRISSHGVATVQWTIVELGSSSPMHATIRGDATNGQHGPQVFESFVRGLAHLKDHNTCPELFDKDSLDHTEKLVRALARGIAKISFFTATAQAAADKTVAQHASYAIKILELKPYYTEHGTIEGTLKQLGVARGKNKLMVVDGLTGKETPCYVDDEGLEDLIRRAWKCRVAIEGMIRVARDSGEPDRVDVEKISILREESELTDIDSLPKLDITGGVESSEYVRNMRDDE